MKPVVIRIINDLDLGGAQKLLLHTLKSPLTEKYSFHVLSFKAGLFAPALDQTDVPFHQVNRDSSLSFSILSEIREIIQNLKPDFIHCSLFAAGFWGRIAAILEGIPALYSIYGITKNNSGLIRRGLEHLLSKKTVRITVPSRWLREYVSRYYRIQRSRITTLRPGVPSPPLLSNDQRTAARARMGFSSREIVGIYAGRLQKEKCVTQILSFLRTRMFGKHPRLLIVGDGPERSVIEDTAKQQGWGDRITFTGSMLDPGSMIDIADIALIPSQNEGFPLFGLEAAVRNLPILATDNPGIRELSEFYPNISILDSRDWSTGLAAAMERLVPLSNYHLNREVIDQFSIETYISALDVLYTDLLES